MAEKKKSGGKGGLVLTDEQKIALIRTGNPNGNARDMKKANMDDLMEMQKKKAVKRK